MTKANPKIACIIAFYNGSDFIERAVESCWSQTLPFEEIIIVNDGSKPLEAKKLDQLYGSVGRIRLIHKDNGGQGSARNAGVFASSSDYVCFLDQDDFYLEEHNEILIKPFLSSPSRRLGFVYADLWEGEEDGSICRYGMVKDHSVHPKKTLIQCIGQDMFILPSASMITREAFIDIQGFDESFTGYEDDDLFMRLFRKGWAHIFVDQCVTVWCINSKSTSYSIRMDNSRIKFVRKLCEMFGDDPVKSRFLIRDQIAPRFVDIITSRAVQAAFNDDPHKLRLYEILVEFFDIIKIYSDYDLSETANHIDNLRSMLEISEVQQDNSSSREKQNQESLSQFKLPYKEQQVMGKTHRFTDIERLREISAV